MHRSKYLRLLATLNGWQLNQFQKIIESQNNSKLDLAAAALLQHQKKFAKRNYESPSLQPDQLLKQPLIKELIKGKTGLTRTVHHLLKSLEDFIVTNRVKDDLVYRYKTLADHYESYKLWDDYKTCSGALKENLKIGEAMLWEEYHIGMLDLTVDIGDFGLLLDVSDRLDKAYLVDRLNLSIEKSLRLLHKSKPNTIPKLDILQIDSLLAKTFSLTPYTEMLIAIYQILSDKKDTSHFVEVQKMLDREYVYLSEINKIGLVSKLNSFYGSMITAGRLEFISNYKSMVNFQVKHNLLLEGHGEIQYSRFWNIIDTITKQPDSQESADWLLQFIEEFKDKLPKKYRKFLPDFGRALVHIRLLNDPDKAQKIMFGLKAPDIIWEAFHRREDIKTFFILLENDSSYLALLKAKVKNFERFLKRSKSGFEANHHALFLLIANSFSRLLVAYFGPVEKANAFVEWIHSHSVGGGKIPDETWLLDQAQKRLEHLK